MHNATPSTSRSPTAATLKYKFKPGDEVCQFYKGNLIFGTIIRQGLLSDVKLQRQQHGLGHGYVKLEDVEDVDEVLSPKYTVKWNPTIFNILGSDGIQDEVSEDVLTLTDRTIQKGMKVRKIDEGDDGQVGLCRDNMITGAFRILGTGTIVPDMDISYFRHLKEFKQKSVVYTKGWLGVVTDVTRDATVRYVSGKIEVVSLSKICPNGPLCLESPRIAESGKVSLLTDTFFLQDLKVGSITVRWVYNIDLNIPDPPRREFKSEDIQRLQLVTEFEDTYRLGDLGRLKFPSNYDFRSMKEYSLKFIKDQGIKVDQSTDNCNNNVPIAYGKNLYYSPEEAERMVISSGQSGSVVAEIVHLSGTSNVLWQDGTSEFVRTVDLNVLTRSLSLNVRSIGDFVYSDKFNYDPKLCYGVIQKMDLEKKNLTIRVFSTHEVPKIIHEQLILLESLVVSHPRYQYFNDGNSVVTTNENDTLKIGHVQGSNLVGKLRVRWIGSTREEWCHPTVCSLYVLRGFDLDCIISMTNDDDEVKHESLEIKLQKIVMNLNSAKAKCQEHGDGVKAHDMKELIDLIRRSYLVILDIEEGFSDARGKHFPESKELMDANFEENSSDTVAHTYFIICETLIKETWKFTEHLKLQREERFVKTPKVDGFSQIFTQSLDCNGEAPSNHKFYDQPGQQVNLIKIVKNEYKLISESKAPGIKVRGFEDRFDLFSAAISGPTGTPYENGLYLFDGYLPPSYPHVPPKVLFLPFKSGRLNPNLYDDGKVCLSLLGTWSGSAQEKWTKESNLHQVLISIQGLILVNEPYHNEPGYADSQHSNDKRTIQQRREYNTPLVPKICDMIIEQLKYPPAIWENDIKEFYIENLPLFINRWKRRIEVGNNDDGLDNIAFEIYPLTESFTTLMNTKLAKLEEILGGMKGKGVEKEGKVEMEAQAVPMEMSVPIEMEVDMDVDP